MDIPREALQATAAALWDEVWSEAKPYSEASSAEQQECEHSARTVLEAAFPHLRPLFQHAAEIGRQLGHREAGEEIAQLIAAELDEFGSRAGDYAAGMNRARRIAIDGARFASGASSDAVTGAGTATGDTEGPESVRSCMAVHPMASHIPCVKPAGHSGEHVSRNGRNWRPRTDDTEEVR